MALSTRMNFAPRLSTLISGAAMAVVVLAACVGDDPGAGGSEIDAGGADAPSTSPEAGVGPDDGGLPNDASAPSDASDASTTNSDASDSGDASVDPGPTEPTADCVSHQSDVAGAAWGRCFANATTLNTTGGTLQEGNYILSRPWNTCGTHTHMIGSANLSKTADGFFLFRYKISYATCPTNPCSLTAELTRYGTWWLKPNSPSAGKIQRTEECESGRVDYSESGTYSMDQSTTPPNLYFAIDAQGSSPQFQEGWKFVP